ncbi:Holliday junction branch migration protein RuvA [Sporomusa acidovorans]|uniref:Holliday junction branch migration complex subunit RuvA n=1 Tax=Sporomusa acidovorans (strain ATCC 49682 / DSM 3132 / Mol) TaxID=1123286 RepID=A0ABZ3J411_SPOA4|nr:Holliday junction branch migration protein RuvA [Sporomusa acidovorans]OZC20895.1 holliday junction ATP-dependent DNA helicase RuvA [Sporomusa acidovorans DSM 3132]SDE60388.1 Holliday junction DNA helicase subunit RuvA [Sporomusa acidovorans]
MIGYVKGVVTHLFTDYCFIDVQGVGYRVFIPNSTRQKLVIGQQAILFTYLNVREDAITLHGFYTQEEYELFLRLISVSGIGPKVAAGVLSAITPQNFRSAISTNNAAILTKLPGIGKKTAERMILELKDKIGMGKEGAAGAAGQPIADISLPGDILQEAVQALISLGYNHAEITPVIKRIYEREDKSEISLEQLIKLTLKEFGRR